MEDKKICVDCQSAINKNAKRCIKCGAFLDWRRYSSQVSTLLALILAAIATFAWAEPMLKKYILGYDDELSIMAANTYFNVVSHAEAGSSLKGLQIAISNTGDRSAFVQDIAVFFEFSVEDNEKSKSKSDEPNSSGFVYLNELPEIYRNSWIIKPGNSELFKVFLTKSIALPEMKKSLIYYGPEIGSGNYSAACKASVDWVSFEGETGKLVKVLDNNNCSWILKMVLMRLMEFENDKA